MARFLIEVQHDPDQLQCARVVQIFLSTGSHFLTHADWGCMDGVHSAWILVDVDSKTDALAIVPPALRPKARVTALNQFTLEMIDPILRQHEAK